MTQRDSKKSERSSSCAIVYSQVPHKKINGTLFYCFEYFEFLSSRIDTTFYIHKSSQEDLNHYLRIFKDKYTFNHNILNNIKYINGIRDVHNIGLINDKILFLDIRSANMLAPFVKNSVIVYSNKPEESHLRRAKYFGFYDYQYKDVSTRLKFNFNIFNKITDTKTDTAFVSAPKNKDVVASLMDIKESNMLVKQSSNSFSNLFSSFDTLYYYHNGHDANNRLIVESLYYNKTVVLYSDGRDEDSAHLRYKDISDNGIEDYTLTEDDAMIKEIIYG